MNCEITQNEPLQYQLIKYMDSVLLTKYTEYTALSIYDKCQAVFDNFRLNHGEPVGLKLSVFGNRIMSKCFDHYGFSSESQIHLTGEMLVKLDQQMTWPYYLSSKKIVLYNEIDAACFKLGGCDLKYFTKSL
jgi:hypothetical protein